ncbi:hypothetical protein GCM10009611_10510 [Arthrobacter roseus]
MRDHGSTATPPTHKNPMDLFFSYVRGNGETGCWEWTGSKVRGYGSWGNRGATYRAHRWAWANVAGLPLPDADLDHICENPSCVRPGHMQPASRSTNLRLRYMRAAYEPPAGTVMRGPVKHRSLFESVYGMQYGLPTVWQAPEALRTAPTIQADMASKPARILTASL